MLAVKEFNGKSIRIRKSDRYVCLTDMAQATGKRVNNWLQLSSTESYLQTLATVTGIPVTYHSDTKLTEAGIVLIEIYRGGDADNQGTWAHPKVSLRFAQWCSDLFAVQVDTWIDELLTTGSVSLQAKTPAESLLEQAKVLTALCQQAVEHERRLAKVEAENQQLKETLEVVEMETQANTAELERFRNGHGYYYSIAGYCSKLGQQRPLQWMNNQGRKASAMCRQKGIVPEKVSDPRWGTVNTYPDSVLNELTW